MGFVHKVRKPKGFRTTRQDSARSAALRGCCRFSRSFLSPTGREGQGRQRQHDTGRQKRTARAFFCPSYPLRFAALR
nr:MAG TPA: hypothetical protein [Caudoviricetes sp.]